MAQWMCNCECEWGTESVNEAEYRRILDAGMGRAVSALVSETDTDAYHETIRDACLRYTAFDPATEGNRSNYLFRVIEATGNLPAYRDSILAALSQSITSRYDRAQHFALAARFAQRGDMAARQAIYSAFFADTLRLWNPRDGSVVGAVEIIALDGWQGFLAVAEHLGALRGTHPQMWFTDGLLTIIERRYGVRECALQLIPVVKEHVHIAAFMTEVFAHRQFITSMRETGDGVSLTYTYTQVESIIARADTSVLRRSLTQWGMKATDDDLRQAATALTRERDPMRAAAYATLFAHRPFPADPAPLLALARGTDLLAAQAALTALAHVAHPSVRVLARELRDDPVRRVMAVDLLVANYADGDAQSIRAMLDEEMPPQVWHWLGYGALRVFAAHPDTAAAPALYCIYERTPCSHCRSRAVRLLCGFGSLPGWMVDECRHDVHPGTRALSAAAETAIVPDGVVWRKGKYCTLRASRLSVRGNVQR